MGFNLIQFRNELRRDLKDSGALWSDAELNRCVQRAVDDLSRFLPKEEVYEITYGYAVTDESFTTPATASAEAIVTAANGLLSGKVNGDNFTIAATARQITPPRRLTVTKTDSDSTITKITITVKGYDQNGNYVEESWHLKDIITSGTAYQGKVYFKRVDLVTLTLFDGGGSGDAISVGTGNAYDSFVFLANKPIRPESETVTSSDGTITLARDTDYYMDYANGGIKFISEDSGIDTAEVLDDSETDITCDATAATKLPVGTKIRIDSEVMLVTAVTTVTLTVTRGYAGTTAATHITDSDIYIGGMAQGISYLIDYDKSRIGIDISSILPVVTRIQRVQYPADLVPQQFVSFNIIGDFMFIGSKKTGESQGQLTANEHIAIYYERKHMPPGEGSAGSYPDVLDEVISIGSQAYALLMMALKYEHQAVTDIGYVDTALDKITTEMGNSGVDGELTNAGNVWADEVKHILTTSGIPGMETFLELGDDLINVVNVGADVAELYRRYAETAYLMARSWEQKRADFLTEAVRYLDKADAWNGEASNRIANAGLYLEIANRWRQEGIERRNEFWSILRDKSEYRKRVSSTPVTQPA